MYHLHPELELISEQQQVRLTEMPWGKRRLRTRQPHGTSATLPSRAWQEPGGLMQWKTRTKTGISFLFHVN